MVSNRAENLRTIAEILRDYREGEVAPITAAHVSMWASQFGADQDPVLSEMAAVLPRAYYSRAKVVAFLSGLVTNQSLAGADPCAFWRSANLLDIQTNGSSQRELLGLLRGAIAAQCGPHQQSPTHAAADAPYVYIDDGIFTGITIIRDVKKWLLRAPTSSSLHVIAIGVYRNGMDYAAREIFKAANAAGKIVNTTWWSIVTLENDKAAMNVSDVLWPNALPEEALPYAATLAPHYPQLRIGTSLGRNGTFSTHEGRVALEQAFLKAGIHIRSQSPLAIYQRPLGNIVLRSLGFGALFATYRNCPNNCPLAVWCGSPWVPLLPRRTNAATRA